MKRKILMFFTIGCVVIFLFLFILVGVVFPKKYQKYVEMYSSEYGLDSSLIYAIIKAESDFNPKAISGSGAVGLMQIIPTTAEWIAGKLNIDFNEEILFDPQTNILFGCFYLKYLFDRFKDEDVVICAYNAGEGKVLSWLDENGKVEMQKIDFPETKNYLKKVRGLHGIYKNNFGVFKTFS